MPAQSQQQQKLFGLALAFKRGEVPASEVSDEIKGIADSMTEKEIEDFASTPHSELPTKVESQLRGVVREIMREKVLSEVVTEEKYTVIDPKGNSLGTADKTQVMMAAKKRGGTQSGFFVVSAKNALKARRALEKFKGDFKNPKLKDMMSNLFYGDVKSEGNAFGAAVVAAKKAGEDEFEVGGKTFKVERVTEVKYPTDLKIGSVILGQGFTMLKGIEGGRYYKIVDMDDFSATLVPSDKNGNVKGSKKVRHKLDSIEGGIKTAKRGDENGIVVIKESVNEAKAIGKKIFSDTKGKLFLGYQNDDDTVQFVDYKTWKKLPIKDLSNEFLANRIINSIVKNERQFNKKVEYNMWSKKTNPSFEDRMDYFIKNNWISNITKTGIKESVNENVSNYTTANISKFAVGIASLTATRPDAVQKFVDTHNLDIEKLYQFLKRSKLDGKMNFVSALVGKPGNPIQKKMIKMFQESVNEVSYEFGKKQYTDRNMTPTDILDLAMAYTNTPITKLAGKSLGQRVYVANDLARLAGTTQQDATKRGKPALILLLYKGLLDKSEYMKLYRDLIFKQSEFIKKYLTNADPASRMVGGAAARQAHKDMKGYFDESKK